MSRRIISHVALGLFLALGAAACSRDSGSNPNTRRDPDQPNENVNPGDPLFQPAAAVPNRAKKDRPIEADPVVLKMCHMTLVDKQDVPSQVDGVIAFIGVELAAGEKVQDPRDLWEHPRTKKQYRKLKPGDRVNRSQVMILLDDANAELELKIADSAVTVAKADVDAAEKTIGHVRALLQIEKDAYDRGAGSLQNMRAAEANVARYESEKVGKFAAVKKAEGEFERARLRLRFHDIASAIVGEVVSLNKEPGESVRANETILQVQNHDRLRVEGFLPREYEKLVQKGLEVTVEPTILRAPMQTLSVHKALPITAIAVSNHAQRPLVVSGGQDGMVYVWDRSRVLRSWAHKGTVRAIACTGRGTKESLAVTGAEDGLARIWDLNRLSDTPVRELNEREGDQTRPARHPGGVTAAAFSPNGEYIVTADGERNIYLWKTATGEKVYRFPQGHAAAVSALHFTPQCRVISVGRDNVVNIWKVGDRNAALERTEEHRSGEVTQLGVTDDGNWMALDHDKTRLHISSTDKEGITERVLNSLTESTPFGPFATFSPQLNIEGNRLLLTASNQGRIVQLWRHAPTEDRTREILRLVPQNNVPATVAAFSPYLENGFIVMGTERGDVHLWAIPPEKEINRVWTARVAYVDDTVDPTARQVKMWATMENDPAGPTRLKPGSTAEMVIRPVQPK